MTRVVERMMTAEPAEIGGRGSTFLADASPRERRRGAVGSRSVKLLLKRSPLGVLLLPRRFHAYCVGPAKSGTVSVKAMFSTRYRSDHEATFLEVVEMAVARLEGRLSAADARRRLRRRDRELRLEMDSFNQLGVFVRELAAEFPRARFVLTVRQPRSWLRSILNQHLRVDLSNRPAERRLRELFFHPAGVSFSADEEKLERLGLFPVDGYLRGWSNHVERVLDGVPADRLLVVPTDELSSSSERLAAFLSIPPETIDTELSHMHRAPRDFGVFERLPEGLVEEAVHRCCSAVLTRISARLEAQAGGRTAVAGNGPAREPAHP